jgi:hypothetical protein
MRAPDIRAIASYRSTGGLVAVTIALVLSALCAHGAPAATYTTLFADPGNGTVADTSLEDHALSLINATPPGAQITFAFRDYNRPGVTAALIAARDRDVRVDGVIDGGERNRRAVRDLVAALGPDHVVVCGTPDFTYHSCIADTESPSLMHNKFLTFSRLADGREHVVLQTSMNFLAPEQHHVYNDMVEITGDRALHDAYVSYLFQLKTQARSDDNYLILPGASAENTIFTSPRRQPDRDTNDTIVDRMDDIDCSRGGAASGRGLIRIAQLAFRTERAVIMRKLIELKAAGCDIEVLSSNLDPPILAGLVSERIPVHPLVLHETPERHEVIIHDKFWLVDAVRASTGARAKITYAGSSNWRADEQRSDDLLLRMLDPGVYERYSGYFELIRSRAESDPPTRTAETVPPAAAIGVSPPPVAGGFNDGDVTVRVVGSDGVVRTGSSGLRRLHVEMTGAQTGQWEFTGETDGYHVEDLEVRAEGTTTVTAWAEDEAGNVGASVSRTVHVDKSEPSVVGMPQACTLWPPDNRLTHVATIAFSDSFSGIAPGTGTVVAWSDDVSDSGDIVIEGGTVLLRAEKAAYGRARTYTIVARAQDLAGHAVAATATCLVPHSQGVPWR